MLICTSNHATVGIREEKVLYIMEDDEGRCIVVFENGTEVELDDPFDAVWEMMA
jgi:hypothetical protein